MGTIIKTLSVDVEKPESVRISWTEATDEWILTVTVWNSKGKDIASELTASQLSWVMDEIMREQEIRRKRKFDFIESVQGASLPIGEQQSRFQ